MALLKRVSLRLGPAALSLAMWLGAGERPATLTEAQVKAGLLYNFATFVEWPDSSAAGQPFLVCVEGADQVGEALRGVEGRTVHGRRLGIRRITSDGDARACHVLFISAASPTTARLLSDLRNSQVLTVGEHEQFSRMGGIVRLFSEDSRIRFEIDVAHAERSKLKISSKLLGLARLVKDGNVFKP